MATKLTKVIANFETQLSAKLAIGTTTLNGTSTGSNTANTLNDSSKAWTTNQYAGYELLILSGTGAGQRVYIASNTSNQITIVGNWTTVPDATSVYQLMVSSANLVSATDKDGVALPAGKYCFAIDLGQSNEEHIIADLNGTVLKNIKSVSRQGVKTDGAVREHRVGAKVKLTDFINLKVMADLLAGADTFDGTAPLAYDIEITITDRKQFATAGYVQDLFSGVLGSASNTLAGSIKTDKANNGKPRAFQTLVQEQSSANATLKVLPFKIASGDSIITFAGGDSPSFINPGFAGDLNIALNPSNTETFVLVINGTTCTFNFVSSIGSAPGNVLIGATAAATRANLAAFINNPGATSANQVAFTGAQLTALGLISAVDDLSLNIFIKSISETLTSFSGSETMAGAGNTWTANTTKNRLDLLVYDTVNSALKIRRGTEAVSPAAPNPTNGDIVLAEVYNKVGQSSIKDNSDGTNGYISAWYLPQVFRTDIQKALTFPVYETLSSGDLVKSLNHSGTFKAAKIIGLKTALTNSITKSGDLVKVEELNSTTLIILTTAKLYKADWDPSTGAISNLVDLAPTTVPSTFAVLDSQNLILGRYAEVSDDIYLYTRICNINGGIVSFGAEQSVMMFDGSGSFAQMAQQLKLTVLSPTSVVATMYVGQVISGVNYNLRAMPITISSLVVTFGTLFTSFANVSASSSTDYGVAYYNKCIAIDSTKFALIGGYDTNDSSSRPTPSAKTLYVCSIAGGVITANETSVQTAGTLNTNGSLAIGYYNNALYLFMTKATTTEVKSATLSGIVPTISSVGTLASSISISDSFLYDNSFALISGTSIYSFRVGGGQVKLTPDDSLTDPNLYKTMVSTLSCFTFSNDTAVKSTKFLLDRDLFIGIANKSYTTNSLFGVSSVYEKTSGGLIPGINYYIGENGQSLTTATSAKKVGRAVSDRLIIKE